MRAAAKARRLRVLMLARSGQFWSTLEDTLRDSGWFASRRSLKDLDDREEDREKAFTAAVHAFSTRSQFGVDLALVQRPQSFAGEDFGLMLALQMSALVAVHGRFKIVGLG